MMALVVGPDFQRLCDSFPKFEWVVLLSYSFLSHSLALVGVFRNGPLCLPPILPDFLVGQYPGHIEYP